VKNELKQPVFNTSKVNRESDDEINILKIKQVLSGIGKPEL